MFSYCFRPRREFFHPVKNGWNDIWRRIAITRLRNLSMRKILPQVEARPRQRIGLPAAPVACR
ncbi:hypothetical protein SS05631_c04120 [Sinorhizobium sp. CCBAU 05631]|nr:hypothetical protein SS05631_c04120 [Sinorhizobium sp. CCBAU 05631]